VGQALDEDRLKEPIEQCIVFQLIFNSSSTAKPL